MKKTIKERIDAFIEDLKKDYPEVEADGLVEAFVLVGISPCDDGRVAHYEISKGNYISICEALTGLFDNQELVELVAVASNLVVEKKKQELAKMIK